MIDVSKRYPVLAQILDQAYAQLNPEDQAQLAKDFDLYKLDQSSQVVSGIVEGIEEAGVSVSGEILKGAVDNVFQNEYERLEEKTLDEWLDTE